MQVMSPPSSHLFNHSIFPPDLEHTSLFTSHASAPPSSNSNSQRRIRHSPSSNIIHSPHSRIVSRTRSHSDAPYRSGRPARFNYAPSHSFLDSSPLSTNSSNNNNSPTLFPDPIEDQKPILGIHGSPHLPSSTANTLPPMSPSPPRSPLPSRITDDFAQMTTNHYSQPSSTEHSPASAPYTLPSSTSSLNDPSLLPQMSSSFHPIYSASSFVNPVSATAFLPQTHPTQHIFRHLPQEQHAAAENQGSTGLMNATLRHGYDDEIVRLQNRIRELEYELTESQHKLSEFEDEDRLALQLSNDVDAQFRASWNARTNARTKKLCSLNRAGNALCRWHDTRRERRQYPPRMAPGGMLNCGCTYDEALFEESLSRHNIGSYLPGETVVRIDPRIRNPLLKLLKERYGYKDGDFERIRQVGHNGEEAWVWPENDDAEAWTTGTALIGNPNTRRGQ